MSIRTGCLLLASTLAFAQQQTGSLTGRVVNAATNAPVVKARVFARLLQNSPEISWLDASTDNSGNFHFTGLVPGQYTVGAIRSTFLRRGSEQYFHPVKAGETTTMKDIALTPQAVIRGRVLDANGEPVEQAYVSITSTKYGRLADAGGAAGMTDDRGEFRIADLTAGTYRIAAFKRFGVAVDKVSGQRFTYARTFFPDSLDIAQGADIGVDAGVDRSGVDIRLRRVPVVRISGVVDGEFGKDEVIELGLKPVRPSADVSAGTGYHSTSALGRAGAGFTIDRVPEGEYLLRASTATAVGTIPVRVGATGLSGIRLRLQPLFTLEGKITPARPPGHLYVGLVRAGEMFHAVGADKIGVDGTFKIERVPPGRYRIDVTAPEGWVLGSVAQRGQPVPFQTVDLGAESSPIEIAMHNRPGSIEGVVENTQGVTDSLEVYASELDGNGQLIPGRVQTRGGFAGVANGKFRIGNLRAAKYRVIAVPRELREIALDPTNVPKLAAKSAIVTVSEGVTVPVSLRPINEKDVEQN